MQPFTVVTGPAVPLMLANVDTDVIIRIERLTQDDRATLRSLVHTGTPFAHATRHTAAGCPSAGQGAYSARW